MKSGERSLSVLEKYYFERNINSVYSVFFVAGVYSQVDPALLSHALRAVLLKYAALSLNAFGDSSKTALLRTLDRIEFDTVVEYTEIGELVNAEIKLNESVTKEILKLKLDLNVQAPLWRILVINKETVVFITDHLLVDGTSGVNFHLELLKEMNKLKGLKISTKLDLLFDSAVDTPEIEFSSQNDDMYNPGLLFAVNIVFWEFAPNFVKNVGNYIYSKISGKGLTGEFFKSERKLKLKDFEVSTFYVKIKPDYLKIMLLECKSHKVQLTSLLMYIASLSVSEHSQGKDLTMSFPASTRNVFDLDPEVAKFGVFVKSGSFVIAAPSGKTPNWEVISSIQDEITKCIKSDTGLKEIGMLKYVDPKEYVMGSVGNSLRTTVEISNLGLMKSELIGSEAQAGETSETVKLVDLYFNQCIGFSGGLANFNVASTTLGGMNIAVTYHPSERNYFSGCEKFWNDFIREMATV